MGGTGKTVPKKPMNIMNIFFPSNVNLKNPFFKVSYVVLTLITLVSMVRSILHILLPDGGAESIATIPLSTLSEEAQAIVIGMFALWGLSQLLASFFFVYLLIAKKSWMAFAWLLVLLEYLGRLFIGLTKPFETVETAPGAYGNYIFIVLSLGMLLWYAITYRKRVI